MASAEVDFRDDEDFFADDTAVLLFFQLCGFGVGVDGLGRYNLIRQGRNLRLACPAVAGDEGEEAQLVAVGHDGCRVSQLTLVAFVVGVLVGDGQQGLPDGEVRIIRHQLLHLLHGSVFQRLWPRHVSYELLAVHLIFS